MSNPSLKLLHNFSQLLINSHTLKVLSTLIASCGLRDPLAQQHPERPFPASYFRGKNRIDYILVTPQLVESVQSSGSLPLYSLFQGDHRPYYIDLTAAIAFADNAYEIARPKGRGLQLHDPRIVAKYNEIINEQAAYHKLTDKAANFQDTSSTGTWTDNTTEAYQRADKLASENMLHAERKAGRKYTTAFDWSPQFTPVSARRNLGSSVHLVQNFILCGCTYRIYVRSILIDPE
jgi:hypothetical protein